MSRASLEAQALESQRFAGVFLADVTRQQRHGGEARDAIAVMDMVGSRERPAAIADLGEQLGAVRLRSTVAIEQMRASMARHGQLTPLVVHETADALQVIDGFKRVHAARLLKLESLRVLPLQVGIAEAKAAMLALNASCRLSEIEEGWLVRSLYREDQLTQPEIGRVLGRDKSWVNRRLALVESLDETLQADLHLGVISASAAREIARLPRGNQRAVVDAVLRRGLTAHQTARLVQKLVICTTSREREAVLNELDTVASAPVRTSRPRTPAEQVMFDASIMTRTAGRLQARLLEAPPSAFGESAAALILDVLSDLVPILVALSSTIERLLRLP